MSGPPTDPRRDARVPCPQCGGAIHPVAGRCKHCKADLAALRGARPAAQAALPPLVAHAQHATFTPYDRSAPVAPLPAPGSGPTAPGPMALDPDLAILPPRVSARMHAFAPQPAGRWPMIVIAISGAAIAISIAVMLWPHNTASASAPKPAPEPTKQSTASPDTRPQLATPPPQLDVRPPSVADLTEYTKDLPGWGNPRATIVTTHGAIHCELFADKAPMTVANFVGLATGKKPWKDPASGRVVTNRPFYDGLTFHRVIEVFMIQGGDPLGTGTGGPGYQFGDEIDPSLRIEAGSLAMANAGPNTNGSQFFIAETRAAWLDGRHTVFGKCGDLDVIKKIARVPQSSMNKPDAPITMTVTISR